MSSFASTDQSLRRRSMTHAASFEYVRSASVLMPGLEEDLFDHDDVFVEVDEFHDEDFDINVFGDVPDADEESVSSSESTDGTDAQSQTRVSELRASPPKPQPVVKQQKKKNALERFASSMSSSFARTTSNISATSAVTAEMSAPATKNMEDGLVWHAQIVDGEYFNAKYCNPDGSLKKRRPFPIVRSSDFFSSLEKVRGRWFVRMPLNGWPGLSDLELISMTSKVTNKLGKSKVRRLWNSGEKDSNIPSFPDNENVVSVRVTLRASKFTGIGFNPDAPGHFWWYNMLETGKLFQGYEAARHFDAVDKDDPVTAVKVHHFAHRYSKAKESTKDRVVYHGAILVEWNHGKFCTVFELAFLYGVSGYGGKSNWQLDLDSVDPPPKLLTAILEANEGLIIPFRSDLAELRITDVPSKNYAEFQKFVKSYTGVKQKDRFLDPHWIQSADVTLTHNSRADIARYLTNYITHDKIYAEESRNCQTFAADFFRLLTNEPAVPFHPLCQILYKPRVDTFLHTPKVLKGFV